MRKFIVFGFLILFFFACEEQNQTIFLHFLYTEKVEKLTLHINKENECVTYNYLHKNDSIKNIEVKYHLKKDVLTIDKDTFLSTFKRYVTKNYDFKMYQKNEIKSHQRTLVFHKKYGLLCNTGFGADFLFFKDSLQLPETKMIFKEIILELNKIDK